MKTKLVLYGFGGHCSSVLEVVNKKNFIIEKIIDDKPENLKGFKFQDSKSFFKNLNRKVNLHVSFASIYNLKKREETIQKLKKNKFVNFPIIISNTSYISKSSSIKEGTIVMHGAFINANVKLKQNVVINTNSLIEHDVEVGENSHISTSCTINGGVKIGKNCFIGSNSVIKENSIIPNNTFIKMGSIYKN